MHTYDVLLWATVDKKIFAIVNLYNKYDALAWHKDRKHREKVSEVN